jgi:hypothetical protein
MLSLIQGLTQGERHNGWRAIMIPIRDLFETHLTVAFRKGHAGIVG